MAYSVNWITKEITIPAADLTLISGTRYSLNLENFLAEIRRLEWEFAGGLWAPHILEHDNKRIDFSGANYAAFDKVVNGYTVTIGPGPTRVDLIGSNNNISDVINNTNLILVPSNSAGLTHIDEIRATVSDVHKAHFNRRKHDTVSKTITIYEADNVTPLYVFDVEDDLSDITPQ